MKYELNIASSSWLFVVEAAAKKDVRDYLVSVHVEVRGRYVNLIGTNGHILACIQDGDVVAGMGETQFTVPLSIASKVKDSRKTSRVIVQYDEDTREVCLEQEGSSLMAKALDCRYPDWRRVMPSTPYSGEVAQFSVPVLKVMTACASRLNVEYPAVAHNGESGAIVRFGDSSGFCVMMPCRGAYVGDYEPSWV
jgi:DNA polymerase III sliding clamp (beta) subunit (PCNA family)